VHLRGLQAIVEENLDMLEDEIVGQLIGDLADVIARGGTYSVRAWDLSTGCYSSTAPSISNITLSEAPVSATLEHIDDEFGIAVTLDSAVSMSWLSEGCSGTTSTRTVFFQLGSLTTGGRAVVPLSDPLVRAIWNVEVLHGDGSFGVHNATWTLQVLSRTLEEMSERP